MVTSPTRSPAQRERDLLGQTLVVIGGSAGIGLETARLAREEGAEVIITARNPDRLHRAGLELGASIAAFDATDFDRLKRFFDELPAPDRPRAGHRPRSLLCAVRGVRHRRATPRRRGSSVAAAARSPGTRWARFGREGHCFSWVAPAAAARRRASYSSSALTAALPAMTKNLALELAPVRVNVIAAGFVDTPLSATLLGDQLDARREQLRTTLPIGRVVGPADIAALAIHIMTNTALTGATFDIDGGQQLVGI